MHTSKKRKIQKMSDTDRKESRESSEESESGYGSVLSSRGMQVISYGDTLKEDQQKICMKTKHL